MELPWAIILIILVALAFDFLTLWSLQALDLPFLAGRAP
jgi:hypothetical protein